jgi:uncharacterized protein YllA (UPF0747 family)
VVRRIRERENVTMRRLDELLSQLRPGGAPQERVLNALPFIARHGLELLQRIAAAIPGGAADEVPGPPADAAPRVAG